MDTVDAVTRSRIMRAVPRRDTSPEIALRQALHRRGMRYRLNVKKLPGSPDVVFPSVKVAVFVHGCYWHRHESCRRATTPKSNVEFWEKKFRDNQARDRRAVEALTEAGWATAVTWQCEISADVDGVAERIRELVAHRAAERLRHGKSRSNWDESIGENGALTTSPCDRCAATGPIEKLT